MTRWHVSVCCDKWTHEQLATHWLGYVMLLTPQTGDNSLVQAHGSLHGHVPLHATSSALKIFEKVRDAIVVPDYQYESSIMFVFSTKYQPRLTIMARALTRNPQGMRWCSSVLECYRRGRTRQSSYRKWGRDTSPNKLSRSSWKMHIEWRTVKVIHVYMQFRESNI